MFDRVLTALRARHRNLTAACPSCRREVVAYVWLDKRGRLADAMCDDHGAWGDAIDLGREVAGTVGEIEDLAARCPVRGLR